MIAAFLNKPYPHFKNSSNNFLSYFLIGLFVGIFLIVFQPFEINAWETSYKTLKLFGFGMVSFIVPSLIYIMAIWLTPAKTTEDRWTICKEILLLLAVLLCIAAGNLFYGRLLGIMPMSAYAYMMVFTFTVAIGIFPIAIHVILKHNQMLKQNLQHIATLNRKLEPDATPAGDRQETNKKDVQPQQQIHLLAENEKDTFILEAGQLIYIASADNYCEIVYTDEGRVKKHLFRSSLKRIESQLQAPHIIRCHRAYIVNLRHIKNIEGNAAGYKVFFNNTDEAAYVSRNYIPAFNERLKA